MRLIKRINHGGGCSEESKNAPILIHRIKSVKRISDFLQDIKH